MPKLHYGHEKYGFFDLIPDGTFITKQLHRAILYGAFLKEQGQHIKAEALKNALPEDIAKSMENGDHLSEAILLSVATGDNGRNTNYSTLEKLTLVVDEATNTQQKSSLKVCHNHDESIYWEEILGTIIYRTINPEDHKAIKTKVKLVNVEEQECPICVESMQKA
jgi:hypothetical protein